MSMAREEEEKKTLHLSESEHLYRISCTTRRTPTRIAKCSHMHLLLLHILKSMYVYKNMLVSVFIPLSPVVCDV